MGVTDVRPGVPVQRSQQELKLKMALSGMIEMAEIAR